MTGRIRSETGTRYVPHDFDGDTVPCSVCGNPAPVRAFPACAQPECSPCFIGAVANRVAAPSEIRALIRELRATLNDSLTDSDAPLRGPLSP